MGKKIGRLGEEVIEFWLKNQEYQILHNRWHCRYAEIDLIAQDLSNSTLCFIEVKTRSLKNWDNNGIFAINNKKQEKMILGAEIFLSQNDTFMNSNCRFDIALLNYQKMPTSQGNESIMKIVASNAINYQGYKFQIVDYIKNAF